MEERRFENVREFAEYVKEHLFDAKPEMVKSHEVTINEVVKNNGLVLTGLVVKEKGINIAPNIYLNDGFNKYENGADVEELISSYLITYENSKLSKDFSVEFFMDFEQVKDRLTLKLINAERNKEMLKECPHLLMEDLAVIFQVRVDTFECGNATITVKKEHAKMWKVGTASLLTYAKLNMEEKETFHISSMLEVLAGMMGMTVEEAVEMGGDMPMYVMSNESKINGACGLIFTEMLQNFADKHNKNLIICPSSIHELVIILDEGSVDAQSVVETVRAINESEVSPEEVLSDNAYYYDRKAQQLQLIDTREPLEIEIA